MGGLAAGRSAAVRRLPALLMFAMVSGCDAGAGTPPPAASTGSPPPVAGGTPEVTGPAPSEGPSVQPTVDIAAARLRVDGEAEVVYDWSTASCGPNVIPDLGAHAFRDADDLTHLVLSWTTSYRMSGPSLDALETDCRAIGTSGGDARPGRFDDNEWIVAPYSLDGRTVYALVHNEYQGHTHSGRCPTGDYFDCWDNSITLAISTDGGTTFRDAAPPPGHLIATYPVAYDASNGPSGYREPSNIVDGRDGFSYAYFNVSEPVTQRQWVCVMRTDTLADPKAWRYHANGEWLPFVDPYRSTTDGSEVCPPLDQDDIGHALNGSVTWNTALQRFVLVGISADQLAGRETWGVYYAFSEDLVQWTRRRLLLEIPLPWTVADAGRDLSYLYPTLLDPDSPSRNYETTDDRAYLYLTRNNHGHGSLDRDLVRYPVVLTVVG